MKKSTIFFFVLSVSLNPFLAGMSHAQTIDEIIATAERKETNLQKRL